MIRVRIFLLVVIGLFLSQLSVAQAGIVKKAKEAESSGYTVDTVMKHQEDLPFQKVWKSGKANLDAYSKIYIAPVNTDYLSENSWWKSLGLKNVEKDVKEIADYTRDTIINDFQNDPKHRFVVVDEPGEGALVVEMAITELVPNKAGFEAALTGAAVGVGSLAAGAVSAVGGSLGSKSSIAFEMRLRDGGTKKIIGMVADREEEQAALFNVKNYTWYGHAKSIIKSWADQFVKIANRNPGEIISDTPAFTFKPW